MNLTVSFIIHEALAGALFYTCFCRAVSMDSERTSYGVIGAFYVLGLASILLIAAPIVSAWRPSIPTSVLMVAIIVVQLVTSHFWHAGVPRQFRKTAHHENLD